MERQKGNKKPQPSGGRIFKCNICDRGFKHRSSMAVHRRTHTGETPYECPICHKKFGYNSSCMEHVRKVHNIDEKPKDGVAYSCSSCTRLFRTQVALKCHKHYLSIPGHNLHTVPFPAPPPALQYQKTAKYNCPKCPFKSNFSVSMKSHMKIHNIDYSTLPVSTFRRIQPQPGTSQTANMTKSVINDNARADRDKKKSYKIFEFDSEEARKTKQPDANTRKDTPSQNKGTNSRQTGSSSVRKEQQPSKSVRKPNPTTSPSATPDSHSANAAHVTDTHDKDPATRPDKDSSKWQKPTIEATQTQKTDETPRSDVSESSANSSIRKGKRKIAAKDPHQTTTDSKTNDDKVDTTETQCKKCKKVYKSNLHLRYHTIFCRTVQHKRFRCFVCNKVHKYKWMLNRHILDCHKDKVVESEVGVTGPECKICKKVVKDNYVLMTHMRSHSEERPFTCSICPASFKHGHNLRKHIASHEKAKALEKERQCKECGVTFPKSYLLFLHLKTVHKKTFAAEVDSSVSAHVGEVTDNHADSNDGASSDEDSVSNSSSNIQQCSGNKHGVERLSETLLPSQPGPYVCDICGLTFSKRSHVTNHINEHLNDPVNTVTDQSTKQTETGGRLTDKGSPPASSSHGCKKSKDAEDTRVIRKIQPPETTVSQKLSPEAKIYDRYLDLSPDDRKHLHNQINHLFCLSKDVIERSQIAQDKSRQSHKYECQICFTKFTLKENLQRHVRNRPFEHAPYFKRRLGPVKPAPFNQQSKSGNMGAVGTRGLNTQKLGTSALKAMKEFINMVLNKVSLSNVMVPVPTTKQTQEKITIQNVTGGTSLHQTPQLSAPFIKQYFCDICACPYTRRFNMLLHRRKHTDEEFVAAGVTREIEGLYSFSAQRDATPPRRKRRKKKTPAEKRVANTEIDVEPVASSETAGYVEEGVEIYMDTDYPEEDTASEEMASEEVQKDALGKDSTETLMDNDNGSTNVEKLDHEEGGDESAAVEGEVPQNSAVGASGGKDHKAEDEMPQNSDVDPGINDNQGEDEVTQNSDVVAPGSKDNQAEDEVPHNSDVVAPGGKDNQADDVVPQTRTVVAPGSKDNKAEDVVQQNSTAVAPVNKANTACPLCELLFLEKQKTITCHLCCFNFCMECSKVPRELHAEIMESDANTCTGYVWMCSVCRPLLPRLAVVMNQLGDLEHYLNTRISDLEKKVGGIQQICENSQKI